MKPPLRPLAATAIRSPSISTTSRSGLRCLASNAAQSPVSPPPTIASSQVASPVSGADASGRSEESSQYESGSASA